MNPSPTPTAAPSLDQLLEQSIPDYVRGSLSAEQCAVIEQRQTDDAGFAALIAQERALQSYFAQVRAGATVPSPSFAALRQQLQQPSLRGRLKQWFAAPAALQPTWAAAAALAVLVAAVGLWRAAPPAADPQQLASRDASTSDAPYQTLTTHDAAVPAGAEWRLVFAPAVTAPARAGLLQDFALQALSAPDGFGAQWVRSTATTPDLAARLRSDPRLLVVQAAPPAAAPEPIP